MRGHTECRPVSICLFQRRRGRLRQCCGRLKSRHRGRITRTHMRTSCKRLASARTVVMHSPPQGHTPHAERHTQKQRDMQMQTQAGARIAMPYSDGDHLAIHPICLFVSVYLSGWLAGSLFLSLSHPPSLLLSLSPFSLSFYARTHKHTHDIPTQSRRRHAPDELGRGARRTTRASSSSSGYCTHQRP